MNHLSYENIKNIDLMLRPNIFWIWKKFLNYGIFLGHNPAAECGNPYILRSTLWSKKIDISCMKFFFSSKYSKYIINIVFSRNMSSLCQLLCSALFTQTDSHRDIGAYLKILQKFGIKCVKMLIFVKIDFRIKIYVY